MDSVINEGRDFYNTMQQEGLVFTNLQVCVLGDVTERQTQSLFQFLPFFLQYTFPDIAGMSAGRGLLLTGFLFIPHKMNHMSQEECGKAAVFVEEMNMLIETGDSSYYVRVIAYQDIQKAEVRYYPELNVIERTDLLFQYLLNIFYLESKEKGVFLSVDNKGIYSMGAASVFYYGEQHRQVVSRRLLECLLDELKKDDNASVDDSRHVLDISFGSDEIAAGKIIAGLEENNKGLNLQPDKMEGKPEPDPVKDFLSAKLFTSYYLDYLRFMPARAVEFARAFSYMLTGRFAAQIKENKDKLLAKFKEDIDRLHYQFRTADIRFKTVSQLKGLFTSLRESLEKQRQIAVDTSRKEEREVFNIPEYLSTYYSDLKHGKESAEKTSEIAEKMKTALRSEPAVLSLISRCFLIGTALVFVLIPLLRRLSPFIIDLGDVTKYEWLWIILIFTIIFLYYFGIRLRRHFLYVRKLKRLLLAQALLDAQRKASARIYTEALALYDELIACCETKIKDCDKLSSLLLLSDEITDDGKGVPQTMFNQPFIAGKFMGEQLTDASKLTDYVLVGHTERLLPDLKKDDYILILKQITEEHAGLLLPLNLVAENEDKEKNGEELNPGNLRTAIAEYVESAKKAIEPLLRLHDDENLGEYINMLMQYNMNTVDLLPLFKIADLNGMLTDSSRPKKWHVRSGKIFDLPGDYNADFIENAESENKCRVFVSSYCSIRFFDPSMFCGNTNVEVGSVVPLSVKTGCFFAQYLHDRTVFMLNNEKLNISHGEMTDLKNKLKDLKLWNL
jgi:hypothetical protein